MSLGSLEPADVWRHFESIIQIPRSSGHEELIREHILLWSVSRGFDFDSDEAGNLFIRVPAARGYEKRPEIILQAHMDMVTEKDAGASFDFLKDPIEAVIDGDFLRSISTTLGADNGIGLAAAMALAEDQSAVRGPLLLVFTVDEERGLTGAKGLDGSRLSGCKMINLDSEDEAIYIGCAGAEDCRLRLRLRRESAAESSVPLTVRVRGLAGGHSGVDIDKNNANAIKILARMLLAASSEREDIAVVALEGGGSRNAIPREAMAIVRVMPSSEEAIKAFARVQEETLRKEFPRDPDLSISVSRVPKKRHEDLVWLQEDQMRILRALVVCPHGVLAMSQAVPGLVETSNNLAILRSENDSVDIFTLTRSSGQGSLEAVTQQIKALGDLLGAEFTRLGGYPAWEPNPDSELVQTARSAFERLTGKEPELRAVHAGLECGIIGAKSKGRLEMISLGPAIEGAHTPKERVRIASVGFFYSLLREVISDIANGR